MSIICMYTIMYGEARVNAQQVSVIRLLQIELASNSI